MRLFSGKKNKCNYRKIDKINKLNQTIVKLRNKIDTLKKELSDNKVNRGNGSKSKQYEDIFLSELRKIAASGKPIICGPWITEVGFELLYWIPFLNWFVDFFDIDRRRLTIISRGGVTLWYKHLSSSYYDVFDLYSIKDYDRKNQMRSEQFGKKHYDVSAFDNEIVSKVTSKLSMSEYELLHPKYMYESMKLDKQLKNLNYARFQLLYDSCESDDSVLDKLPANYIAAKFYYGVQFDNNNENRIFLNKILQKIANRHKVVLLLTGLEYAGSHIEPVVREHPNIIKIDDLITPSNNLYVQSMIIANSKIYIGNYGGFSYLPCFLGVPAITFYNPEVGVNPQHLQRCYYAFRFIRENIRDKNGGLHNNAIPVNNDRSNFGLVAINTTLYEYLDNFLSNI